MNNMIIIRGDKIAFSYFPGCYGDTNHIAFDLTELVTPFGLFIPVHEAGTQVLSAYKLGSTIVPHRMRELATVVGLKGVLISPEKGSTVQWHQVKMNDKKQILSAEMPTGQHGHACLSVYDHLQDMASMSIRLTSNIEDTVAMYCRNTFTDVRKVRIWDRKQCFAFIKQHWNEKHRKRIEMLTT